MSSPPRIPAPIRKFPAAFAGFARSHNQLLSAVRILTNVSGANGISIAWSDQNVIIRNTKPDIPILAGTGIGVTYNGSFVIITDLAP